MYQSASIGATGFTEWVPLNYRQRPFETSIEVIVPSTVTGTFTVDYTYDDLLGEGNDFAPLSLVIPTSVSRTTTTATVVSPLHGLNVGDSIRMLYTGGVRGNAAFGATSMDGVFSVAAVTDANTFTYAVANSGVTAGSPWSRYIPMHVFSLAALTAKSASTDAAFDNPVRAVRLRCTAYSGTGNITMTVLQGQN
jgi:hypothetical protein